VPAFVRPLIVAQVRRTINRDLHGQGIGRHSRDDIVALAIKDIRALSDFLGNKTYFMGEKITGADAVVHAFLVAAMVPLFEGPIRQTAIAQTNLVEYVERLNAHWYPGEMTNLTHKVASATAS